MCSILRDFQLEDEVVNAESARATPDKRGPYFCLELLLALKLRKRLNVYEELEGPGLLNPQQETNVDGCAIC